MFSQLNYFKFVKDKCDKNSMRHCFRPKVLIFFLFYYENKSCSIRKKHLDNAFLMSTNILCFHEGIRIILSGYPSYRSEAMNMCLEGG